VRRHGDDHRRLDGTDVGDDGAGLQRRGDRRRQRADDANRRAQDDAIGLARRLGRIGVVAVAEVEFPRAGERCRCPAGNGEVARDPGAPAPAMSTCGGGGASCAEKEVCGSDGADEDCDGWADRCDASCNDCKDDAYEPNDVAVNVPTLMPGTYPLKICPCRDDWFAFHVAAGNRIHAIATFTHAALDLDLRLYAVDGTDGETGTQVASSTTTSDTEEIDYVATEAGAYFLRVYPFQQDGAATGSYQLRLE
jgi:hypothetical protein